jgi:hypothetical protein
VEAGGGGRGGGGKAKKTTHQPTPIVPSTAAPEGEGGLKGKERKGRKEMDGWGKKGDTNDGPGGSEFFIPSRRSLFFSSSFPPLSFRTKKKFLFVFLRMAKNEEISLNGIDFLFSAAFLP